MRIEVNPRRHGYDIYCDTDSEYHILHQLCDSDIDPKSLMKCYLNSVYGKAVMNMNKEYIVVHLEREQDDTRIGIIFKSKIIAILKANDGTAIIFLDDSTRAYCTESYESIVKQLV